MKYKKFLVLVLVVLPQFALAADAIWKVPCMIIDAVFEALTTIFPLLFAIMFLFGGAKYVFSADDPGGRKQGRTIVIQAIIAGIIYSLVAAIVSMMKSAGAFYLCPGMHSTFSLVGILYSFLGVVI